MRKTISAALGLALSIWLTAPALSSFITGNDFHETCLKNEVLCNGLAAGLGEMTDVLPDKSKKVCFEKDVSTIQVRDVFKEYLKSHPSIRHRPAGRLFYEAMKEAFPCP